MKTQKKIAPAQRGFTLIETMVAITILVFALVGPFQIAQGVLTSAYTARDELIAASLGQEAIEYVREVRDSNYLYNAHHGQTLSWLSGFDGNTTYGPDCYQFACVVDPSQYPTTVPFSSGSAVIVKSVKSCNDATCAAYPLYISSANIYNQQTTGTVSRFTRKVQFTQVSPTETKVTVTVSWTGHGSYSVVLSENLQNWL